MPDPVPIPCAGLARRPGGSWPPPAPAAAALLLCACVAGLGRASRAQGGATRHDPELLERVQLVHVVDGDTLDVLRRGRRVRVRLLGVDTEERLHASADTIPAAPQTVFGEETALWLADFLAAQTRSGEALHLRLLLPAGSDARDAHGRLLAHLVLPDGRDLNVLLVRKGFSPYFQRYGSSEVAHEAFERAQADARRERLGIWNPRTNAPGAPGAPRAARDYAALVSWWQARAAAIGAWREAREGDGAQEVVAADRPEELLRASRSARVARVFGEVEGARELSGGALIVFLRAALDAPGVRLLLPATLRAASADLDLVGRDRPGRQSFVWVRGRVRAREGAYWIEVEGPRAICLAGPEPAASSRREASAVAPLRGSRADER